MLFGITKQESKGITYSLIVVLGIVSLSFSSRLLAQTDERLMTLMANNCLQCHARPETGAPIIGNTDDWQDIVSKGEELMLLNVIQGIAGMPPLGYCSACSENDFKALIRFMTGVSGRDGQ